MRRRRWSLRNKDVGGWDRWSGVYIPLPPRPQVLNSHDDEKRGADMGAGGLSLCFPISPVPPAPGVRRRGPPFSCHPATETVLVAPGHTVLVVQPLSAWSKVCGGMRDVGCGGKAWRKFSLKPRAVGGGRRGVQPPPLSALHQSSVSGV